MSDVQLTVVEGDVAQVIGAIPGPQGPAGAVAAAIDGSAALPSIAFASDTDTGLYRVSANQLGVSTGGTQRLVIDETGQIEAASLGTQAAPTWTFVGDPDTGAYSPGANQFAISTGGTGRLFVDASGRAGIGTSSPTSALEINGTITIGTGGTQVYQAGVIGYTDTNWGCLNRPPRAGAIGAYGFQSFAGTTRMQISDTGTTTLTSAAATPPFIVNIGASEVARIDSSGRLGIGTSSPGTILDTRGFATYRGNVFTIASFCANNTNVPLNICQGTDGTHPSISAGQNSTGTWGALGLMTSEQYRMLITSAGNVGIGTVSPSQLLSITTASNDDGILLTNSSANGGRLRLSSTGTGGRTYHIVSTANGSGAGGGKFVVFDNTASDAARLVIDSSGNVGIGTATPGGTLDVKAAASTAPLIVQGPSLEFARIDSSGRLLVGTSTNTGGSLFQINDNRIRIATAKTPASATDTGSAGEICWDANYIYVCTATNTWKRTAIATW